MNICVVATSGDSLINFRGRLIKSFVELGHTVYCLSIEPPDDMKTQIEKLGAKYFRVNGSRVGTGVFEGLRMIRQYEKAFRMIKPDMCFFYMSKPVAFGGEAAIRCHVKHLNVLVNGLENAYYRNTPKDYFIRHIMSHFYKKVSKHADNVFLQNSDDFGYFIKHRLSDEKRTSVVNGSGVDMEFYERMPLPDEPVVLMVSRLLWSKGIREFLSAVKSVKESHPEVKFMLVGGLDSNDEALSESELNDFLKDCNIEYCGYASDVRPYLGRCSIFVLPSYHEGTPRCILEAMAAGRAIITTDAPGCRETVIDGVNGYIVPVGNSRLLAERIETLSEDSELRSTMAVESYRICAEKYEVLKVNCFMNNKMFLE